MNNIDNQKKFGYATDEVKRMNKTVKTGFKEVLRVFFILQYLLSEYNNSLELQQCRDSYCNHATALQKI